MVEMSDEKIVDAEQHNGNDERRGDRQTRNNINKSRGRLRVMGSDQEKSMGSKGELHQVRLATCSSTQRTSWTTSPKFVWSVLVVSAFAHHVRQRTMRNTPFGPPQSKYLNEKPVTNWHFSRSFHFYFIALTLVVTV